MNDNTPSVQQRVAMSILVDNIDRFDLNEYAVIATALIFNMHHIPADTKCYGIIMQDNVLSEIFFPESDVTIPL